MNKTEQKIVREYLEMMEKKAVYRQKMSSSGELNTSEKLGWAIREEGIVFLMNNPEYKALRDLANNEIEDGHTFPHEEPQKVYKLSEMYKVWMRTVWGELGSQVYITKEGAEDYARKCCHEVIAITPADSVEFYEGQGLED